MLQISYIYNMKKLIYSVGLVLTLTCSLFISCSSNADYGKMKAEAKSSGLRSDTVFKTIALGQTKSEFQNSIKGLLADGSAVQKDSLILVSFLNQSLIQFEISVEYNNNVINEVTLRSDKKISIEEIEKSLGEASFSEFEGENKNDRYGYDQYKWLANNQEITILIFTYLDRGTFISIDDITNQKPIKKTTPAKKEVIIQNNGLDGSVYQVEDYLKDNLKNADSYEGVEWFKVLKTNYGYTVRHKYRARNSFNAVVIESKLFSFDNYGNVTNVE
jgi:hypothetical protein